MELTFDQGWSCIEMGINKLKRKLEGDIELAFNADDYTVLYNTIYKMCTQKPPNNHSRQLYKKYQEVVEDFANQTVLSLRKRHDEEMPRELVRWWNKHKGLVKCLSHFFSYLDSNYILKSFRETLLDVGLRYFRDLVYYEMRSNAIDTVKALINKDREGEQIDGALLKNLIDMFVEIGVGDLKVYEQDLESLILQETTSYYSRKASSWIQEDSCPQYMLKTEECLKGERKRATRYFHSSTEPKLVEKLQDILLAVVAKQIIENEDSGCGALLREEKMDDLSRMYRLYHTIPRGLEPIADIFANIFKQQVEGLITQAEEAAATDQAASGDGMQGQVFLRNLIKLRDNCMMYVTGCFQNHGLFHKAMEDAFDVFSYKEIAGSSCSELLAMLCDNVIRKEGTDEDRLENMNYISRIHWLFLKIPQGLESVADSFTQYVIGQGGAFIKQAEDAAKLVASTGGVQGQELVSNLINLHNKSMAYVINCFQNQTFAHKALKQAFETLCESSVSESSFAELLAMFCHNVLKKGGGKEKLNNEAIEDTLEKVVNLVAYTSEKDIFAEFYRKKQARRLLFDRSGNDEHEIIMLLKLKDKFGRQFTSKMEGMVTDMTLARETQNSFKEYITNNTAHPGIDLSVTVLRCGFWPTFKTSDLNLPSEMVKCVESFKAFYDTKTKSRKLRWIYSLGTCHITGQFDEKPIDLVVSTYQAVVLLLFNNAEQLSYNEIYEQLKVTHEDLVRLLHSLSCAEYKILKKEPMSKTISDTDVFVFNTEFTNKRKRIMISHRPLDDDRKKVRKVVDTDRRHTVDACITRIMKSRKVLGHQQLLTECVEILIPMFKPDINMIEKRVQDLIDRDYLERDGEHHDILKYVP